MYARILCPGLSLNRYRPSDLQTPDVLIAVNRAATGFCCDVWACSDYPLVQQERRHVAGLPDLLTAANSAAVLRDSGHPWLGKVVEHESLRGFCPAELQWDMFTLPAAAVYAAWRGASVIEVYGADWSGMADFDGAQAGGNRSEARWMLERQIWTNRLVPWLENKGITVRREVIPA